MLYSPLSYGDNLHYEKFADGSVKCIEDEIPFDLPDGWAWAKINTIAFVTKLAGFEYTKNIAPGLCEDGIPLFKGKNVQNSTIVYEFESFIPESVSDELQRSQVTKKCILTPYVGTIGNIGIHNRPGKYHLGSNVGKIELYNDNAVLLEEYVVAYLQSGFGYQQLTKHMKATAQASISIEAIRDVYLPIPPANEQLRMWSALSNALAMIERIENTELDITNLIKSTKSKILDLAIRGKLVPQDPNDEPASVLLERIRAEKEELIKQGKIKRDKKESVIFKGEDNSYYERVGDIINNIDNEIPFELPPNWEWSRLQTICYPITDGTHKTPIYSDSGYIFLSAKNITTGKIDWNDVMYIPKSLHDELYSRVSPKMNDILLAKNGTTGVAAIVDRECEFDIYVTLALLRVVNNNISSQYLLKIIASNTIQDYFKSSLKGIGVPNLHLENIRTTLIPIPPINEQKKIAEEISQYYSLLDSIGQNVE